MRRCRAAGLTRARRSQCGGSGQDALAPNGWNRGLQSPLSHSAPSHCRAGSMGDGVYATLCSPVRSPKFALYRLRSRSPSLHCADAMMIPLLLCPLLPKSDVIGAVGRPGPFQHEANCHASKQYSSPKSSARRTIERSPVQITWLNTQRLRGEGLRGRAVDVGQFLHSSPQMDKHRRANE